MLTVEIISPEKAIHRTTGVEVILPTTAGELGIRTGHLPLLAQLKSGTVVVKKENGKDEILATFGGIVEVFENTVYLMVDSAELADDLDELKVQEAIHRAEELKAEAKNTGDLKTASAMLAKNFTRLKAVRRFKHHGHHARPIKDEEKPN
ncbi:MAG TPA: ATP synthase F1 subunit epsilon [Verrucomicrobiae bacterium]|nr:ATP synthase F1 subunit epsilon [Verrucomicrobiae bacterium]